MNDRNDKVPAVPRARRLVLALTTGWGLAAAPASLVGQPYTFESEPDSPRIVDRMGSTLILEAEGPSLVRTGPIIVEHDVLHHRWFMMQDSTVGVVLEANLAPVCRAEVLGDAGVLEFGEPAAAVSGR